MPGDMEKMEKTDGRRIHRSKKYPQKSPLDYLHYHDDDTIDPSQDSDSDSELDIEGPSSPSDLRDEELVCETIHAFSSKS